MQQIATIVIQTISDGCEVSPPVAAAISTFLDVKSDPDKNQRHAPKDRKWGAQPNRQPAENEEADQGQSVLSQHTHSGVYAGDTGRRIARKSLRLNKGQISAIQAVQVPQVSREPTDSGRQ